MKSEAQSPGYERFLSLQQERVDALRQQLNEWYPAATKIALEIGCGHGHYLTAYAGQYPQTHCLGLDLVTRRIRKANDKRDKRNLHHLHFLKAEVREFMMAWPAQLTLERVFVLFPDPWPKKRHAKNRIIQHGLLDELAKHSRDGTVLHFRTDDEANFNWGMDVIASHDAWTIQDDYQWPFENPSYFQDLFTSYQSLTALFAGRRSS